MSKIANKQMICEVLMDAAKQTGILLLCAVIPEAAVPLLLLQILIRNSLWKQELQSRIW